MDNFWSRRAFLRGAGGVTVGLPLLASLGWGRGARADNTAPPKRLIIMFSPNGTVPKFWSPKLAGVVSGERIDDCGPILKPLEALKEHILVCEGIDMMSAKFGPGDGHQTGMGHMLTARELLTGDLFEGGGDSGGVGWGGGISIDQAIANEVGKTTKFKSLELGVQVHGATVWSRMSYLGANQPIPPELDPEVVYQRVFGDLGASPAQLIKQQRRRKSVLDLVLSEYNALVPRLDAFDRAKLEAHVTAIREVESRLTLSVAGVSDNCVKPDAPDFPAYPASLAPENYEAVGQLQMDLAVQAMACDITRVATIQFSQSVGGHVFTNLGINQGHHDLSHEGDSNADAQDKLMRINQWYAAQMAYLIRKLKSVPEGEPGKTMLDNTLVVWVNELGKGNSHTRDNMPYVLAGSCGGFFKTGRYIDFGLANPSHNDMLLTWAHAMGLTQMRTFGDTRFSNGPLSQLYT